MMTSVTLPSSSGSIHGSFTTSSGGEEQHKSPISVTESGEHQEIDAPRPLKRCLSSSSANAGYTPASFVDSCNKKRRKQATPVRISAADSPPLLEGKPPSSLPPITVPLSTSSPESVESLRCPICQLVFTTSEHLHNHISVEHVNFECKLEPGESPPISNERQTTTPSLPNEQSTVINKNAGGGDMPTWMQEMPNKEWLNPNLLTFSPANHMFMGLTFPPHDSVPPRQPIRIFNPDAYCELCNKEFCNKYFLKTHKANKHGIYTDPPTTESTGIATSAAMNIPSYTSNMKIPVSVPSVEMSPVKLENKTVPMMPPFTTDLYGNPFVTKPFTKINKLNSSLDGGNADNNVVSSIIASSNGHSNNCDQQSLERQPAEDAIQNEGSSSPKIVSNESIKQDQGSQEQEGGIFYAPTSKLSPGQQQARDIEISNRLRRIGVMNPKAFCEICCKEYCNKYFLRTHKMKRHGICLPDDRDKDMKMDPNMGLSYMQTSPLNLILAEQSDRKITSSPSDISCDICGIKFQNVSLFQLHNMTVHAKATPNVDADTLDHKKSLSMEGLPSGTDKSTDSISEDLQKLQTMILQLNDLDVNKASNICNACNKEFENRYYLHAHMMSEHGLVLDENPDMEKQGEATEANINNNTICDLCGKDFHNYDELKKHMAEVHTTGNQTNTTPEIKDEFSNNGLTPDKITGSSRAASGTGSTNASVCERRPSMNLTPTSSYCEICNKELCNKYFMKTHMQRMHGIEIENGAQIGGVVCDICNKELCSKYFLRVHKHNTHGIVEYGASLLQPPRKSDNETPTPSGIAASSVSEADPALKPSDLADLSHRYFTHFTEVCTICSRRFRSTKWLKAHLLSDHGQAGAEKWAELEQQLQQTSINKQAVSTPGKGDRGSPTLKIPNSGQEVVAAAAAAAVAQQQQKVGLQNVLSSIFGADESAGKTYHCSYCNFCTPVLPFLFVHERSHSLQAAAAVAATTDMPDPNSSHQSLKCPVCPQQFHQPELLQHHLFSQHPFLPLPPFFNGSSSAESLDDMSKEPSECADENEDTGSSPPDALRLQQCPSSGGNAPTSFVNKTKKSTSTPGKRKLPSAIDQTLKEFAKKVQLPVAYALPQTSQSEGTSGSGSGTNQEELNAASRASPDGSSTSLPYAMQAFLVEEACAVESSSGAATSAANDTPKFMPSVVFLPVLQKLSAPVTATFTLTPA